MTQFGHGGPRDLRAVAQVQSTIAAKKVAAAFVKRPSLEQVRAMGRQVVTKPLEGMVGDGIVARTPMTVERLAAEIVSLVERLEEQADASDERG